MRESFTSGSVGRAPRKRCLYPEEGPGQAAAFFKDFFSQLFMDFKSFLGSRFPAPQFSR